MMPTVYGGLGTTLEAYGFDASIQLSYQLGGKIYDTGYRRLMHGGASSSAGWNWHKDIYNAWTPENPTSNIPRLNANDKYTNSASTRWLTSSAVTFGHAVDSSAIRIAPSLRPLKTAFRCFIFRVQAALSQDGDDYLYKNTTGMPGNQLIELVDPDMDEPHTSGIGYAPAAVTGTGYGCMLRDGQEVSPTTYPSTNFGESIGGGFTG